MADPASLPLADLRLNPNLDGAKLAQAFASNGKSLQIRDVLAEESAELIYQCLIRETPWGLANHGDGPQFLSHQQIKAMDKGRMQALQHNIFREARQEYQYLYHCYPMLSAYQEQWDPYHLLMRFLEFVNMEEVLTLIRSVTGMHDIIKADGQATFFAPNQFLRQHTDDVAEEYRRLAYVFGFTKNWDPNWGGYLQFYDQAGNITHALMPRFNVLSIFAVPRSHSVGHVAPFAGAPRLSITGWFRYK
ncbi:MAG: 2OG-Fe(II) oxygenase [Pseudomonadota bacterium]